MKDRVFQKIIGLSLLPVAEYQNNTLSFTYRLDRNPLQVVRYLYKEIVQKCVVQKKHFRSIKISKKQYLKIKGKKCKIRVKTFDFKKSLRRKQYQYNY